MSPAPRSGSPSGIATTRPPSCGGAHADGCLASDELEQRLELALNAKTRGELRRLTSDLPRRTRPTRDRIDRAQRKAFRDHPWTYAGVNGGLVAIWATTGADGSFWPIWSMVLWGLMSPGTDGRRSADASPGALEVPGHSAGTWPLGL